MSFIYNSFELLSVKLLVRTITIDGSTILSFAIDLSQMNFLNGLRPPISISLTYIIVISKMSWYGGHGESIHDTLTDGGLHLRCRCSLPLGIRCGVDIVFTNSNYLTKQLT